MGQRTMIKELEKCFFSGIYFLFRSFIETELMHESGLFNRFSKLSLAATSTEDTPQQLVIILILKIN